MEDFLDKGFLCFRNVAARLDTTWKNFAAGLDERSTVLSLSVLFHQKAENVKLLPSLLPGKHSILFQYIESVAGWSGNCEVGQVSNDISVLEQTIHSHQTLYEAMCQAYTEVSVTRMSRGDLVTFCCRFTPPARSCCISLTILSS